MGLFLGSRGNLRKDTGSPEVGAFEVVETLAGVKPRIFFAISNPGCSILKVIITLTFTFMFLLIDKPKGITSHDVIDKIRKITGEKKVGHAGTLDPNATGLLIIGVGRDSTKKLSLITKDEKTYEAEVYLGEERDTDDDEGMLISKATGVLAPSKEEIDLTLSNFIGTQEQIPPPYSAIKLKGKKAYELARKGKVVKLKPRKITVYSIKALSYSYPTLEIETIVSSGTYIR